MIQSSPNTVSEQFARIFTAHLYATMISVIFIVVFALTLFGNRNYLIGYSVFTTLFYMYYMYSAANRIAERDAKNYNGIKGYPTKGIILSLPILASQLLVFIGYQLAWNFMSVNGNLATGTATFYNLLFLAYTCQYSGFFFPKYGEIYYIGYTAVYIVPLISVMLGYYLGYKNINLDVKLSDMIYEKKEDTDNSAEYLYEDTDGDSDENI